MPYNLISTWYWVTETPDGLRPVSRSTLQAAWLVSGQYAPEIISTFDANGDETLDDRELLINTPAKENLIARRLSALGAANSHIAGEVQPYSVNHNVARGEWAVGDCQACHTARSRVTASIQLASYLPGGVAPEFVEDSNTVESGKVYSEGAALYYQPATSDQSLYVFGHDRVAWVDWLGAFAVLGAIAGAAAHSGLRFVGALRRPRPGVLTKKVYMYAMYERFWHWLQTFSILLLLVTGLAIHRPDLFGWLSFPHSVLVHNVLAAILVLNAALSLFYHLVSGEIKQFLPHPYGLFDQAIVQARFYLNGIFKGSSHPFEKTPQKKLNPLQQITYFGILNVLLPLQIITGTLMWGVQQWPQIAGGLGGLPFLAPLHSLVAWLFAAFIIGHVYLTTTAHEPLANLKAMMLGWDEVEDHSQHVVEVSTHDHPGTTETQATELQSEGPPVQ
jgi:thiosulfate reductase cytochrome b subunit